MAVAPEMVSVERRHHPVLRTLKALLTVIVLLVVALALFLAVSLRHGPDGQTTMFGRPVYSVQSGSMAPTFNTGDAIIDQPISVSAAEHLQKGQVITFQAAPSVTSGSGLVITHRIYAVVKSQLPGGAANVEYRTKGDANNAPDVRLVAPSAILGLYEGQRIPYGGYVLSTLHQPITFVVLIMIVVVYLAEELVRRQWIALGEKDARRKRAQGGREVGL